MKNKIIKSTFNLILFGLIAKILSMVVRIFTNRIIKEEGMGLFSLITPFMVLLITLSQMGLPTAVAKLVSSDIKNRKKYFFSAFIIGMTINVILTLIIFSFAPFIAKEIIRNEKTTLTIYALAFLPPLVFLSGILKGYCIGLKRIEITAFSQISEEVSRIIFILILASTFVNKGSEYGAMLAMMGVCVAEIFQSVFILAISSKFVFNNVKKLNKIHSLFKDYRIKDVLNIAFPLTGSRIIISIAYFFEPIILTSLLLKQGITRDQIALDYGQLVAYAMPLLFLPGFFANAFATVLLPNMSQSLANKDINKARNYFFNLTLISAFVGLFFSLIFYLFPHEILKMLYGSTFGYEYVQILAFPFALYYIEAPIANAMSALSLEKKSFINNLAASTIRILSLLIFVPSLGVLGVGIATVISVLILVTFGLNDILRKLFANDI